MTNGISGINHIGKMHSSEISPTNSKFAVTGGYGFLAEKLVKRLVEQNNEVVVICRNPRKANDLYGDNENVEVVVGDLIEKGTHVSLLKHRMDGIYHLAASRDILHCEKNAIEAVKSNIISTLNVLDLSVRRDSKFVVGASTFAADKPTGVYGSSKLITEKLFSQFQEINSDAQYGVLRFGPLLYSPGSVLCLWKDALRDNKKIILTNPSATRKFVTADSVVDELLKRPKGTVEFKTKSIKMGDLLTAFLDKYSDNPDLVEKEVSGLREGEQLESGEVEELMTVEEIKKII